MTQEVGIPRSEQEYLARVREGRSLVEMAGDYLSTMDERLDVTNLLLIEIASKLPGAGDVNVRYGGYGGSGGTGQGQDQGQNQDLFTAINSLITTLGGTPVVSMPSGFIAKTTTLASANTGMGLPSMRAVPNREIVIKAHKDNTGTIYVAGDKLSAEDDTQSWPLTAGQSIGLMTTNLNNVWVAADTAGDKVTYTMEVRD